MSSISLLLLSLFTSEPTMPTENSNPTPITESAMERTCRSGDFNGDCWLICYVDGAMKYSSYCALNDNGSWTCTECVAGDSGSDTCTVWNTTTGCPHL